MAETHTTYVERRVPSRWFEDDEPVATNHPVPEPDALTPEFTTPAETTVVVVEAPAAAITPATPPPVRNPAVPALGLTIRTAHGVIRSMLSSGVGPDRRLLATVGKDGALLSLTAEDA